MFEIAVTLAVLSLLYLLWAFLRNRQAPTAAMLVEIRETVLRLQKYAAEHFLPPPESEGSVRGLSEERMEHQTAHVNDIIRFVYTVSEEDGNIVHTVSSQLLRRKPDRFQVQCMLIAMLTLSQQLEKAGINPEQVSFDISRSALGTHFVSMHITPEQHEKVMAVAI